MRRPPTATPVVAGAAPGAGTASSARATLTAWSTRSMRTVLASSASTTT
ncbi:hypothetical protein ABZX69_42490 [Streptomyces sp. NPDC004074]